MKKCIIIDDSKFMRKIIAETLIESGYSIAGEADNGQDGINLYENIKPDFVTMDITMAGKDGITAIKEIKQKFPESKIVVISALSENTIKNNDKNIEADAFITKPFEKKELIALVDKLLS
ncbi:MAG: response regulator [Spirochaetes bacterium]|nr:response regulator [Spirochaetota bacterium]